VVNSLGEEPLLFEDDTFDLIINRHGAFLMDELIKNNNYYESIEHRFIIVAKNN
jgi:hypothetical protein